MRPLARSIIRYMSLYRRDLSILTLVFAVSVTIGIIIYSLLLKTVIINDNGDVKTASTMGYTVKEVLKQENIELKPNDDISIALTEKIQMKTVNNIYIKRAVPLTINADGKESTIMTSKDTVFEALNTSNIPFNLFDRVLGATLNEKVEGGMELDLVRVNKKFVTEKVSMPYSTIKRESGELAFGEQKVVRTGVEGVTEKTFQVLVENGKNLAKQLVKETILKTPMDGIIETGPKNSYRTSRGGVIRYKKILNMRSTAYTASYADTGKHPGHPQFGITFTGIRAKRGIVAVDPRTIPLGSRLYVEIAGNTPDYGFCLAADTGGAVKGDIIDLYLDTTREVNAWGYKRAKVYILEN